MSTLSITLLLLAILLILCLLAVITIALIRAGNFFSPIEEVEPLTEMEVDILHAAENLAEVIQCETISHENGQNVAVEAFHKLHQTLENLYPKLHKSLKREKINEFSLLYTWEGKDPTLEPVLLAAHQDVVPVNPETLSEWKYPPFSGEIAQEHVWGRGALDIKNQLVTIMDAVEFLLKQGYQPQRTIYLAFGHDEEIGGRNGAQKIAEELEARGISLKTLIDEGGGVVSSVLPAVKEPVALIGIAEKGSVTLEMRVEDKPGHSASPPRQTAIGILAEAITRLERKPMPAHLSQITPLFEATSSLLPFYYRLAFANLWLFGNMIKRTLQNNDQTNAIIRTTTAVTMVKGGIKINILPPLAECKVNFRLFPGDSIEDILKHTRKVIDNPQVKVRPAGEHQQEASAVSPNDNLEFKSMEKITRQIFGNIPVAPYLVIGGTDSRHYEAVCRNIYRFSPMMIGPDSLGRVHGINECISLKNLENMLRFFITLIQTWGTA